MGTLLPSSLLSQPKIHWFCIKVHCLPLPIPAPSLLWTKCLWSYQNSYMLKPNLWYSGGIWRWVFGRWRGHKGKAPMNGISTLKEETPDRAPLSHQVRTQWEDLRTRKGALPKQECTLVLNSQLSEQINVYGLSATQPMVLCYSIWDRQKYSPFLLQVWSIINILYP